MSYYCSNCSSWRSSLGITSEFISLAEMKNLRHLRLTFRPAESECAFNQIPWSFVCILKFEKCFLRGILRDLHFLASAFWITMKCSFSGSWNLAEGFLRGKMLLVFLYKKQTLLILIPHWECSGRSVVRTRHFHCCGQGSNPGCRPRSLKLLNQKKNNKKPIPHNLIDSSSITLGTYFQILII